MSARNPLGALTALAIAAACGCASNRYQIELSPSGEAMQRELTAWRTGGKEEEGAEAGPFPREELTRIAGEYGAAAPTKLAKKHRFSGVFSKRMPSDVGGSGSYLYWKTSLGTTSGYVERFRGDDDLAGSLEKRQAAAESVVDLLAGFLKSKLRDAKGYDQLEKFLEHDFRRDVRNLSLYSWTLEISSRDDDERAAVECAVRCGQYLAERGYFQPEDFPAIFRAMEEANREENPEVVMKAVQRFLAGKMGQPNRDLIPGSLQFLADATAVEEAFADYIRKTDEFRARLAQWEQRRDKSDDKRPKPTDFFGDLLAGAFLPGIGLAPMDGLDVRLASPRQPYETNGTWLEDENKVHWTRELTDAPAVGYPVVLYAFWSVPDEAAQREHFGEVILKDEDLGQYCLWRQGLTAGEARQWDTFVEGLKPGLHLPPQIGDFRFQGHQDDEGPSSIGRQLLLSLLAPEE